jgi:ribosomal protein S18 acetylase RimI-like enzyme
VSKQHEPSVRPAAKGDLDAVAIVWHDSAVSMDGAGPDMPSREALRLRIDMELEAGWVLHLAVLGKNVVGMLALKPCDATLDQIFVSPNEQGRGIGRALLDVAKRAMPGGFRLRMAASNRSAGRFYQKEGMKLLGDGIHPRTGIPVHYYGWYGH